MREHDSPRSSKSSPVIATLLTTIASGAPGVSSASGTSAHPAATCCEGRRHACWGAAPAGSGKDPVGVWLGRAAAAEAASVHSFHHLSCELAQLGAPGDLILRARAALRDEVRHARFMEGLAREWRCAPKPVPVTPYAVRGILELAVENAVEGCAQETFAALLGLIQAGRATNAKIATVLRRVAHDELRHAQLAWDLHAWFLTELEDEEASEVEQALFSTLAGLERERPSEYEDARLRRIVGLPSSGERAALAAQMHESLRLSRAVA